jgi:hypothetical protein
VKKPKELAIDEAKLLVKIQHNYTCEKCGKSKPQVQIHGAHIMPVTYAGTAALPENILCLCAGCHSMGPKCAHQNQHEFVYWMDAKFPGRYLKMKKIAIDYSKNPYPKKDWVEIRANLKNKIKEEHGNS